MKKIANKKFGGAQTAWDELREKFPESAVVAENADKIEDRIEEQRGKYLESQVKPRYFSALRITINKRAREKYTKVEGIKEPFTLKVS